MSWGFCLLLLAVAAALVFPIWAFLSFRKSGTDEPVREGLESRHPLPQEWALTYRAHCIPTGCPRLSGAPPAQPRDEECEMCAALFMERYMQHVLTGENQPRR